MRSGCADWVAIDRHALDTHAHNVALDAAARSNATERAPYARCVALTPRTDASATLRAPRSPNPQRESAHQPRTLPQ